VSFFLKERGLRPGDIYVLKSRPSYPMFVVCCGCPNSYNVQEVFVLARFETRVLFELLDDIFLVTSGDGTP
jgi:hypothetical protein